MNQAPDCILPDKMPFHIHHHYLINANPEGAVWLVYNKFNNNI